MNGHEDWVPIEHEDCKLKEIKVGSETQFALLCGGTANYIFREEEVERAANRYFYAKQGMDTMKKLRS